MYSAPYAGGYPNAAGGPIYNTAPPQAAHLQPGPSPNQHQQQMMYNSQQSPMPGQPGFYGGPNPALMGGVGPAGMMQNPAMPHMAANGQAVAFQPPFTSSPYGAGIPSSAAPQPQLPANFMMPGQMAHYQMNAGMSPQQQQQHMMQQRMAAQQNPATLSVSTPQRSFNPQAPQGTPTSSMPPQQSQYSTPQQQGTPQSQTPTTQQPPASVGTPQTPTFPTDQVLQQQHVNGTSTGSTPQSPATESRDKERFTTLLEINQELLYESIQLVNSRNELKKEQAAADAPGGTKNPDIDYVEEEKIANQDYNQCMRRLQANLTYMFALADRSKGKPVPASPAYLTPPPLNLQLKLRLPPAPATGEDTVERPADPMADRAERDGLMKGLYRKLQNLYPGVDPRKEPAPVNASAGTGGGASSGGGGGGVMSQRAGGMGAGAGGMGVGGGGSVGAVKGQSQNGGSNHSSPAPVPSSGGQGTPLMGHAAAPQGLGQQGQQVVGL